MDSTSGIPPDLRPPARGDIVHLTWLADVGAGTRVGQLAGLLHDLSTTIVVGERWGATLARAAAQYQLMYEVGRRGEAALVDEARRLGFSQYEQIDFEPWHFEGSWWRPWRPRSAPPFLASEGVIGALADAQASAALGSPIQVQHVEYRNPLEVVLTGSGFLILGTIYVMRMVRDWSSKRREGTAAAQEAEAAARRKSAEADLMEWLVDEAKGDACTYRRVIYLA